MKRESKRLTKSQAIKLFDGKVVDLARALKLTRQAVYAWPDGEIPKWHDLELRYELIPDKAKKILRYSNK